MDQVLLDSTGEGTMAWGMHSLFVIISISGEQQGTESTVKLVREKCL